MSDESTQPFNINENTAQPSHRPEHDKARDEIDERLKDDDDTPITPEDTIRDSPEITEVVADPEG
jgi:hypothetical protein